MALKRTFVFLALAVVCLLSFPWRKSTADEWLPIDPAELKMTSEPKAPGAPAIYLYRQVDRKDLGRGNTEYDYVRIKILTEEGRKYGNVEIPYYANSTGVSNIRGRTIRPDGSVVNFDGKILDTTIQKSRAEKYQAKTFTLPDVQVGSIIEYHYNYDFKDGYVYASEWIVSAHLFTKKAKFSLKPYERRYIQWSWPAGLPAGTPPPKEDPDKIVRMNSVDVPAFETEDHMPPEGEVRLRVNFVYSDEPFEDSPDKFWKKFGKKQYDETEKFMDKHKEMQAAVATIIAPSDSADTKLRKIYARCQQVTNLHFVRGDERVKYEKVKNNNVEDVLKNGVGVGKEINLLFVALARAAGFEAYYVRLSSRSEYFFKPNRMNVHELDADAVLVKSGGQDLYLDPATKFAPFGLLPWQETGVAGLRLDKDGGTWITTSMPDSAMSKVIRQANLKLDEDGSLEGTVVVTRTGVEALWLRLYVRFADDTQKKNMLEEQLKNIIPATADVELKNKPDWDSSEDKLVAEYEVKIPGWASSAGKRVLVPVGLFSGAQKHVFEHTERHYAVYFPYNFQTEDDTKITLPAGWKIDSLPQDTRIDAKAADYVIHAENKGNTLEVTRTMRSDILLLEATYYPALRTFYQKLKSGDEAQAVLLPGASSASN